MSYRPAEITITGRCAGSYCAYLILRDDGISPDGADQLFRGFDLEQGPYYGLTRRRAWRKAYRAAGRHLYDVSDLREAQQRAGGTTDENAPRPSTGN